MKHKQLKHSPEYYNDLGIKWGESGSIYKAIKYFKRAVERDSCFVEAFSNLGTAHEKLGDFGKAIYFYKKAIGFKKKDTRDHYHLGIVYNKLRKTEKAVSEFKVHLKIHPQDPDALNNLANIYVKKEKRNLAEPLFKKALLINPQHKLALQNYVWLLQWTCKWDEYKRQLEKLDLLTKEEIKKGEVVSEQPLANISRHDDPELNFLVAKSKSDQIIKKVGNRIYSYSKRNKKKINIGYLSSDFRDHATSHLISELFRLHDRRMFNVFVYSYGENDNSSYRKRIEKDSDKFTDLRSVDNQTAAEAINKDEIDILIDLKGHTGESRLEICALRPSPIQITWLGFPGTTGANFFDYIILDKVVVPPNQAKCHYSEKPIYLPHCYQITNSRQKMSKPKYKRSDFKLPENKFIFASFCQTYKISSKIFKSWMNILKNSPNSILWLYIRDKAAMDNLKKEAEKQGVRKNRIYFALNLPKEKHLSRLKLCDLVLDTDICNGHTTTTDCLYSGVPVITIQGTHFASRVSSSILSSLGMQKLITKTHCEYEALAIKYSKNPKMLSEVGVEIEKNKLTYPLFNTNLFVKNLEKSYLRVLSKNK